jgi:hypothetical protein
MCLQHGTFAAGVYELPTNASTLLKSKHAGDIVGGYCDVTYYNTTEGEEYLAVATAAPKTASAGCAEKPSSSSSKRPLRSWVPQRAQDRTYKPAPASDHVKPGIDLIIGIFM